MRFLAAVIVVPALLIGWQLWGDHSFEQRLAADRGGHLRPPGHGRTARASGAGSSTPRPAKGRCYFDAAGVPEPKLFLTRPTCQRLREFAGHSHHGELDCLAAIDWTATEPLPFDSECYAQAGGRSTPC